MKPRENPFTVQRMHALPFRFDDCTWEELLERLAGQAWHGAIAGSHGTGKTTLLHALADRLEAQGFGVHHIFLNDQARRLPPETTQVLHDETAMVNSIVMLDGADLLSRWQWRRFLSACQPAQGVVIATHQPGLLPTLYTCRSSLGLLDTLLTELAPDHADELRPLAHARYAHHGGNIRLVLRDLYDACSG